MPLHLNQIRWEPPLDVSERTLLGELDPDRLPRHVAIIMDGNGRWAHARNRARLAGHRAGADAVRDVVDAAARLRLDVLTLYAFSRENWRRPAREVSTLMALLREYLEKEIDKVDEHDIRLGVIGRPEDLPAAVRRDVARAVERTAGNRGLRFNLALSYGGRSEIVDACRRLVREGVEPEQIDEARFERGLYTAGLPDPDLLIRTSGELRVSNFLLWQIAYAELWVTDTMWPDFRRRHLFRAIADYQARERRFGGVDGVGRHAGPAVARR